jgi:hypothetical protein
MHHTLPADKVIWGIASTRNASSWAHMDAQGVGTVIKVITGSKYWVLMTPKQQKRAAKDDGAGNMNSIRAFGPGWSPSGACEALWDHEGVLLREGDVL